MKISVITVCFNAAEALESTFASVTGQTGADFEYIIVDGNSTDSTKEFVMSRRDQVDVFVSEPDKGIYDAMNKGVRLASGDWVIFMNAGDRFAAPDMLQRLAAAVRELSDDVDVVYGDVLHLLSDGALQLRKAGEPRNLHRMFFCHQSAMTRHRALLDHPFDISHRFSADFKLYKQLIAERRGFVHLPWPVAVFDLTGISNSRRSEGLADNMSVIMQTDGFLRGLPFLIHLFPSYVSCRLRGK